MQKTFCFFDRDFEVKTPEISKKQIKTKYLICDCLLVFLIAICFEYYAYLKTLYLPRDSYFYLSLAEEFSKNSKINITSSISVPPLLIFFLSGLYKLHLDVVFWGILASMIAGGLTASGVYYLSTSLFQARIFGWWSSLLLIVNRDFLECSISILREPFAWCFTILTIIAVLSCFNNKVKFVLSSLLTLLAVLSRRECISLLLIPLFYCYECKRAMDRTIPFKYLFVYYSVFGVCFGACVLLLYSLSPQWAMFLFK